MDGLWNRVINNFLVKTSIITFIILFFIQGYFYFINRSISIPISSINNKNSDFSISYKSIMPNYGKLLVRVDEFNENISILFNGINITNKSNIIELFVKEGDLVEIIVGENFNDYNAINLIDIRNNIKNIGKEKIILKKGLYQIFVVNLE